MGYSNSFSLRVEGLARKVLMMSSNCGCGITSDDLDTKFCSRCGAAMVQTEVLSTPDKHIIRELLAMYPDGDSSYLLDEDGNSEESGSGYDIQAEISKFSQRYPSLVFILECRWESGLVGAGEPGTDYFFIKNGTMKKAEAELTYTDPFTGQPFNQVK